MKIKSLALILASTALLAACGNQGETSHPTGLSTESVSQESSVQEKSQLDFIDQGKVYFDVQDIDVKFTYGNAVLTKGANKLDLNASATIAVEGTSTNNYHFLYVYESVGGAGKSINLGIEGASLQEFLGIRQTELTGKTRVYVAISMGKTPQWTHGLNATLDENLTTWVNALK